MKSYSINIAVLLCLLTSSHLSFANSDLTDKKTETLQTQSAEIEQLNSFWRYLISLRKSDKVENQREDLSAYSTTAQGDARWLGINATAVNANGWNGYNHAVSTDAYYPIVFDAGTGKLQYSTWATAQAKLGLGSAAYLNADENATDGTVVKRTGSGLAMINGGYLNTTLASLDATTPDAFATFSGSGVIRRNSPAIIKTLLGLGSAAYLNADENATDEAIVRRTGGGLAMIQGGYLNTTLASLDATTPDAFATFTGNGVIRRNSPSAIKDLLGLGSAAYLNTSSLVPKYSTTDLSLGIAESSMFTGSYNAIGNPNYSSYISGINILIDGNPGYVTQIGANESGWLYKRARSGGGAFTGWDRIITESMLGSNAFTSTAYLPLTGGSLSNNLTVTMDAASNGIGVAVKAVNTSAAGSQPAFAWLNNAGSKRFDMFLDGNSDMLGITNAARNGYLFSINQSGNVGIAATTLDPEAKLTVGGKIHSREVKVTIGAGADFVFEKDYNLKPLAEVAEYISENKHLPEIASAKEMEKNGLELGEMNIKLLQKIEELTLYLIEKDKQVNDLQSRLLKLENKVN